MLNVELYRSSPASVIYGLETDEAVGSICLAYEPSVPEVEDGDVYNVV